MPWSVSDKADQTARGRQLQNDLGPKLQRALAPLLSEPVPDHIQKLLDSLQRKEAASGGGEFAGDRSWGKLGDKSHRVPPTDGDRVPARKNPRRSAGRAKGLSTGARQAAPKTSE